MTPARQRLLEVAPQLARNVAFEQLTPAVIAAQAGLDERAFMDVFDSVDAYLLELNEQFQDTILQRLVASSSGMKPGLQRMRHASETQLDICLEHRDLRSLLVQARRLVPRVAAALHKRNQTTAIMISIELKSLGCQHSKPIGRLYCMMVLEAAQIEGEAGSALPEVREALAEFLARWVPAR